VNTRTHLEHYSFSAIYCRTNLTLDGTSIFVQGKLNFLNINLSAFCKEQDLEACAVKLPFPHGNTYILSIYSAPSGNLSYFLKELDAILKSMYNTKLEYVEIIPYILM
jgi:hypothetical protein